MWWREELQLRPAAAMQQERRDGDKREMLVIHIFV
jgi:hypothetical protein